MRKSLISAVAVLSLLALPGAAFASKPTNPGHSSTTTTIVKKVPTVTFVLTGKVTAYTAAVGATAGSITFKESSSNLDKVILNDQTINLATNSKTTVVLHKHIAVAVGDKVIVKVRLAKNSVLAAFTASSPTNVAFDVVDQGKGK